MASVRGGGRPPSAVPTWLHGQQSRARRCEVNPRGAFGSGATTDDEIAMSVSVLELSGTVPLRRRNLESLCSSCLIVCYA